MADVKGLLNSIIDDTSSSYKDTNDKELINVKSDWREKASLAVLRDIITAMMNDQPTSDDMINASIINHVKNDYKGTCYGYLTDARDRLKSPLLGDIIQEINRKAECVAEQCCQKKCITEEDTNIDVEKLTEGITSYDEFLQRLKDVTSKKVIDDVAKAFTKSNDAPVFDDVDKQLKIKDPGKGETEKQYEPENDVTKESDILVMTGRIVMEAAMNNIPMSTDEGMEKAITEYCVNEMMYLFMDTKTESPRSKYLLR